MFVSRIMSSDYLYHNKICNFKTNVRGFNDLEKRTSLELPMSYNFVAFKSVSNLNPLNKTEQDEVFNMVSQMSKDENSVLKGSLGRVFKIQLQNRPNLAVKEFTAIYEGRNPVLEANTLKKLPKDCQRVQKYVDLIEKDGKQYLITTFQEGSSLSKLKDKMSDKLLANILEELFKIERSGISFYDYSMGNIVFEKDEPRFFDFEVAKEQSFTKRNNDAYGDLCHISRNIEFPLITNLAGFEIRTVGKIIGELEKYTDGEERTSNFVERYLKQASIFYKKTADLFREKRLEYASEMPDSAIEYSEVLANLFKNPSKEIISIEKQSMRIKELLTEYWFRNDPDLDHDDALYSDGPRYVNNLNERFAKVLKEISELASSTKDYSIRLYCNKTSELLKMIENKEITYLTKKLCK